MDKYTAADVLVFTRLNKGAGCDTRLPTKLPYFGLASSPLMHDNTWQKEVTTMTPKETASVMLSGLASMLRSMTSPIDKPEDIFTAPFTTLSWFSWASIR